MSFLEKARGAQRRSTLPGNPYELASFAAECWPEILAAIEAAQIDRGQSSHHGETCEWRCGPHAMQKALDALDAKANEARR